MIRSEPNAKIQVIIRKRPINATELSNHEADIITTPTDQILIVSQSKLKVDQTPIIDQHKFVFDQVFNQQADTEKIYVNCVRPLLAHAFEGNKVLIFAYGQTGSGKTFTMNGNAAKNVLGIYSYAGHDLFNVLIDERYKNISFKCQFFEIYCGKLLDLLNNKAEIILREDGKKNAVPTNITEVPLHSVEDFLKCVRKGMSQRITAKNSTNSESSRSHAVLNIVIMNGKKQYSKVTFIDLAGNERGADTLDQEKQTKVDGAHINKSLLALKECIRAIDSKKDHLPFRGSKLTMILRDSIMDDNCRTLMIGNIAPGSRSCENTMNTLRYADALKKMKDSGEPLSRQDQRAKELMLTRVTKNKVTIYPVDEEQMQVEAPHRFNPNMFANTNKAQKSSMPFGSQENVNHLNKYNFQRANQGSSHIKPHCLSENRRKTVSYNDRNDPPKHTFSSLRKCHTPLSPEEFQRWEVTFASFQRWNFSTESREPYQIAIEESRSFLQRELKEYLSLQSSYRQFSGDIVRREDEVSSLMDHSFCSNEELYNKSKELLQLHSQQMQLLGQCQNKLSSYMRHLQQQEMCDLKMKQADILYGSQVVEEDEMSILDEVNSEAALNEECGSFFGEPPMFQQRPVTRQSLHLTRGFSHQSPVNVMRSYEFDC